MKSQSKIIAITFVFLLVTFGLKAQNNKVKDPLLNFKNFYEIGVSINGSRVNTNYTKFTTTNGIYNFKKNSYLPNIGGEFNYGWLFKNKKGGLIWTLKTGLNFLNRNADLTDNAGTKYRLSTGLVQIPLQVGFREPLKYHTVKNSLFRAIHINAGFYIATPFIQKLDYPNNIDAKAESIFSDYLKFGTIVEVAFTALNKNGNGHKFGICLSTDFHSIVKNKETPNELYPYYYTIGLFYNIFNKYN